MPTFYMQPVALTIAGSDSGGGAGIQADLKTFASLGVHGVCVITALTAQNPGRVSRIQSSGPGMVRAQLEAVFAGYSPRAIKTGMLFSPEIIREVSKFLGERSKRPVLVVDPVLAAASGGSLHGGEAVAALTAELLPLATVITPNLDEAEALCGEPIRTVERMRWAARLLHKRYGCAVLVKGGHLKGLTTACDVFNKRGTELLLQAPRLRGVSTHGTGCTYASALAGYCALGNPLTEAVRLAKTYITTAIAQSCRAGRWPVLNWFWS